MNNNQTIPTKQVDLNALSERIAIAVDAEAILIDQEILQIESRRLIEKFIALHGDLIIPAGWIFGSDHIKDLLRVNGKPAYGARFYAAVNDTSPREHMTFIAVCLVEFGGVILENRFHRIYEFSETCPGVCPAGISAVNLSESADRIVIPYYFDLLYDTLNPIVHDHDLFLERVLTPADNEQSMMSLQAKPLK